MVQGDAATSFGGIQAIEAAFADGGATITVGCRALTGGYTVDADTLPGDYRVTHTNLNDRTVEGIAHKGRPVWGVQWHPEAYPGPTDTEAIFDQFLLAAEVRHS